MDIATQAEIVLRNAEYTTWSWFAQGRQVTCFESVAVMGFLHVFENAADLLSNWQASQVAALTRHAASLKAAGAKSWNVYSVFLTPERAPVLARIIERIEEDFSLTRKIARSAVATNEDLEKALLPLVGIGAQPLLGATNFEDRLRNRLKDVSSDAVTAFLNATPAIEVARILGAK